jgi:hypothetical protein
MRATLAAAARAAVPALELLGDYIGNTFEGKVGYPAFDRCQIILDLKRAIEEMPRTHNRAHPLKGAEPAVVVRPDGSLDAYGPVAVVDQRPDPGPALRAWLAEHPVEER